MCIFVIWKFHYNISYIPLCLCIGRGTSIGKRAGCMCVFVCVFVSGPGQLVRLIQKRRRVKRKRVVRILYKKLWVLWWYITRRAEGNRGDFAFDDDINFLSRWIEIWVGIVYIYISAGFEGTGAAWPYSSCGKIEVEKRTGVPFICVYIRYTQKRH